MAQNIDFNKLVPNTLKNEMLDSLVKNLFNRFVSQEDSVLVSGRIGTSVAGDNDIQQPNLERQENELVPGLSFSAGKEKFIFTFDDLINKMEVLGIDVEGLREWMAEQTFNYSPPIDYDKFINYANYYWVGQALGEPVPAWNPDNSPEYYVIERPHPDDQVKMPVRLATTRPINLQINDRPTETFTITFTSTTSCVIASDIDPNVATVNGIIAVPNTPNAQTLLVIKTADTGVAPSLDAPGNADYELCQLYIVNGTLPFGAGDTITVKITYYTSDIFISVNSPSLIGKGTANGVATLSPFMYIDGKLVEIGDRILVKDQLDPSENGIYTVVRGTEWVRTFDASDANTLVNGSTVYVSEGDTQAGYTYKSSGPNFTFTLDSTVAPSPVNDWQVYNYWVHKDDIYQYADLGISLSDTTQANRPIIEYDRHLHMNDALDGTGSPADPSANNAGTTVSCQQVKTRFNQIPQFNLYRYDGTHAGTTSGIWYYVEDPNFETDAVLRRRVARTINSDYIFGCAATDDAGRLYYYKIDGELRSIWAPGHGEPVASTPLFVGAAEDSEGAFSFDSISSTADNQQWTITFIDGTTATVSGIRAGDVGTLTVGTPFTTDDFTITVGAGTLPYNEGDVFTFNIYNKLAPRYVKEDAEGNVINYPGGPAADALLDEPVGAWLTPARMFQNMFRETREEINFGDFIMHGRSVLKWQDGFTGSSFGNNNSRTLNFNPGLGGQIREFSSNYPLLASMLIEQDISPLTILTFAEQQYNVALASIDQFIINEVPAYLAGVGQIETSVIDPTAADIQALEEYFESLRAADVNLSAVFSDTTAKVKNWPATLPMLGLLPKTQPGIELDYELNTYVIKHHDGHVSTISTFDQQLNSKLTKTAVLRSDGTTSAGLFMATTPSYPSNTPYARQLWFNTTNGMLSVFDVAYDTEESPVDALNGQLWYKRSTNQLFEWDSSLNVWVASVDPPASRWIAFSPENVRNSLVLAIEQKLYDSVHPAQQQNLDMIGDVQASPKADEVMEVELASFAAKYNYDTYGPDYDSANAFTWNYSQATIPGFTTVPARWPQILKEYFTTFGVYETDRPDIEPWKLGTAAFPASQTKPVGWDAAYKCTIEATDNVVNVAVSSHSTIPVLAGIQTIDGYVLQAGDKILVAGQTFPQFNGLYTVSAGTWNRTGDVIDTGLTVNVANGDQYAGTTWVLTTVGIVVDTTPLLFEQARVWSDVMWDEIQAHNPGIKLSVNTTTDALLPPYVSPSSVFAAQAMTNTIPSGTNLGYQFGDIGPIELVWEKSLEYNYGVARSYFRLFPLKFLDASWGETYINGGDSLRIERNLAASLSSKKFLMHGERLNIVNSYTPDQAKARIKGAGSGNIVWGSEFGSVVSFAVSHVASTGQSGDLGGMGPSSTVFTVAVDGEVIDYVYEGVPFSFSYGSGDNTVEFTDIIVEDFGIPFELGDTINIDFTPDTITTEIPEADTDFVYGILGCEGCVADATPDPSAIVIDIQHQPTFEFIPGQMKVFKGVGQWFTNLLRFSYIDTGVSTAALAYRNWDINLVHRLGALVRPDSLIIDTTSGIVPPTGYSMLLKRSEKTRDIWISGLRVQVVQMGSKVLSPNGLFVPKTDAADWIFRLEVYNPYHPQIEYDVLDTSGPFTTFYALNKSSTERVWKRYSNSTGTATTTMPLQVIGLQNLLDIIYGYVDQLEEGGFKINADKTANIDSATGRNIDWQLEVEKFIDTLYQGVNAGTGIVLNPFMDKLFLDTPIGLMSRYSDSKFLDPISTQACYDVIGSVIPVANLNVIRTDPNTITRSSTPIFSAHVFIDEYEHAILFNSNFSADPTSTAIFDQFLGSYLNTAHLSFNRQNRVDGKPTFDGFFLNDNEVIRNPASTVDALARAYDAGQTFNEPKMAEHALALVGYKNKAYFDEIGVSDQTQLDFWRGMIGAKGTNLTVDAFTNYKSFLDSSVDEFWAYKLATYGDARERSFPEIKIQPNDCTRQFTGIQFYSNNDPQTTLPLYLQVEAYDDTRWFSIDDLGTVLRFDATPISEVVSVSGTDFPQYVHLSNTYLADTADTVSTSVSPAGATLITSNILRVDAAGTYTVSGYTWNNPTKLSPVKLFDYSTENLITQVSLWHPAIGIHEPTALELVNIQSATDPAHYSYTTLTVDNPNYMALKPWNENEVGRVWWDTSTLAYIPYYDSLVFANREARHSRWGSLTEYASVDLYQWTESDYHPSEYNEQAALQEGDSSIDPSIRLSGQVGFMNYYKSTRSVEIKPIAWSQTSSSNGNAHPSFGPATFVKVRNANDRLIVDTGRLADVNIVAGYNFGAWSDDGFTQKPVGEVVIGDELFYELGNSSGVGSPILLPGADLATMTIESIDVNGAFGSRIGAITLSDASDTDIAAAYLRMSDQAGFYEDQPIADWSGPSVERVVSFEKFGLNVRYTRNAGGPTLTGIDIVAALTDSNNDIFIREAVNYTTIIDIPSNELFSNNEADLTNYGWRVWQVPTQAQLNADLAYPNNKWQPYIGNSTPIDVTADVVAEMEKASNTWTLVNGITISRYTSTWSDWVQLKNTTLTQVSDSSSAALFTFDDEDELDANRLSIYSNGIQLAPSQITISGNTAQVVNTLPEGTLIYALYRPYQPTAADLAFDPTVEDDFQVQSWYKVDYQYTERTVRNSSGNITGKKYYFWVKNKTVPETNKSMSLEAAADLLRYGSSTYMIFSRLVADSKAEGGAAYDSCAISGLGSLVSKTNSMKLRFLRDFTLRDDPEELKLKNVHTEWKLIRERMSDKIPAQLWATLTNAVCGEDLAGNPLPSTTRANYDEKYGTNTRFGFESDQIFVDSTLALDSIVNTILNTSLVINIGNVKIVDYITALNINASTTAEQLKSTFFSTPAKARATMNLIYSSGRASQINEIFFSVLNDALANNYEFTDLFKTSMITVNSTTIVQEQTTSEQAGDFY